MNNNKIITSEHDLREKIYELKDRIYELEIENRNNLIRISKLSKTKNDFSELERANQALNEELIAKEELITELKSLLLQEKREKKAEKRILEKDFDSKLNYYKRLQETNEYKENAASTIIKLNEVQHYSIIQLENKIDEIKNYYENQLKKKELDFDKKYTDLQKDMMEFLKNAQKNMNKTSKKNLELNTKLGILYKNEMLNELENQSHMIEELIKEKERQNKEIYLLKQELIVHKKIEKIIKNKNSKFLNIINKINIKINQNKDKDSNNNSFSEKDDSNLIEKSEKNENQKKLFIKDLKRRVKSVKNIKKNLVEGNAGILNNYLTGNTSNINTEKNEIKTSETPKNLSLYNNKKIIQSAKQDYIKLEENEQNLISQEKNKSAIYNIINEIINLCNQALEIILNEKNFSKNFLENSFRNDIDIKADFFELKNELKYELLIGIITKVLNFLKINNNMSEEKDDIFKIKKKKSELLKLNDEYNLKFSKLFENDSYNKIKKLRIKNQKLKYDKIINIIGINKPKNTSSKNDFLLFKIKKNKLFNQKQNHLINAFRKNTPNPFQRYIHITNNINKKDVKNLTFFKNKL